MISQAEKGSHMKFEAVTEKGTAEFEADNISSGEKAVIGVKDKMVVFIAPLEQVSWVKKTD